MTKVSCATCTFWELKTEGDEGWKIGLGKCTNVPMFFDATDDSENPEEYGDASRVLKPDYQGVKALALDGSGYRAELLTMPDFGCISFVAKVAGRKKLVGKSNKVWTVVRFPNGSWSFGGKPTDPDYVNCEVFRIAAIDGKAAVKKAQARRSREHRLPVGRASASD